MALAVRHVAAAVAQAGQPLLVRQAALDGAVGPSQADAAVVDARKIGLAADAGAQPDVQGVIPDAQLRHRRRIDGRDEVHGIRVGDIDDVLVGADAVEGRHLEAGHRAILYFETPPGMSESDDRTLRPGPLQDREIPRGPVLDPMRPRIVLIFQSEQHEMAGVAGRKSRHLEVVMHPAIGFRQRVVLPRKELFLVVVTGSPCQHRADVERLAVDLTHHVLGQHAFGGVLIVRAACGMHVMIA